MHAATRLRTVAAPIIPSSITIVQSKTADLSPGPGGGTLTFTSAITAGNAVLLSLYGLPTDGGYTYAPSMSGITLAKVGHQSALPNELWYGHGATGGATVVTVPSTTTNGPRISAMEFSGVAGAPISEAGSSPGTSITLHANHAGDLLVSTWVGYATTGSPPAPTGGGLTWSTPISNDGDWGYMSYAIALAAGNVTCTWAPVGGPSGSFYGALGVVVG